MTDDANDRADLDALGGGEAVPGALERLRDDGLLAHGAAVVVCALAARWGVEPADAVVGLAEGRAVGGDLSDFELRAGREEAELELDR